jgi:peptide deformylase
LAILPILELPHPALRQRARKVRQIDSSILRLAYDMVDTMDAAPGIGLAANQVGVLRRVIVVRLPEEDARIYINPEIVHREGEREIEEGCLSIPGYRGLITRSVFVKFRALDHTAKLVKLDAGDLLAQALEHEVDHLNGILYIDHLTSHEKLMKLEPAPDQQHDGDNPQRGDVPHPQSNGQRLSPELVLVNIKRASEAMDSRETPASLKIK